MMLACDLRHVRQHHGCGIAFFLYLIVNIKSTTLAGLTFTQANLPVWQRKLGVGDHDGTLRLGCTRVI